MPRRPSFYLVLFLQILSFSTIYAQTSMGLVQNNTNLALPAAYNFQEYVFAEPNDQGTCTGSTNVTAVIAEVFLSQTHRHAISHPLFFTIGHRPALLQIAVTGTGIAPDVTVEGILNGTSIGTLCLNGPANLTPTIDVTIPDFNNYFSVTLPKSWVQDGLDLVLTVGTATQTILSADLKIGPYTEMNLVMVNMDVMDYNSAAPQATIFNDFLEEMASAIPASVVRFGIFPETLVFPELVASNNTEQLVRLQSKNALGANGIFDEGSINSVAALFLGDLQRSTHDYVSTVYFGNTLNLNPGGWGGGKSFVGFDYTDIFIHELGHALSLPHWGGDYNNPTAPAWQYNYPYGGEDDDGGGRGEAWNFIQDTYEFVSPTCGATGNTNIGKERSDCMQRNYACLETRPSGDGPWDGFGDFSAIAMNRYLLGASVETGQVMDRGLLKDYQLNDQEGFPNMTLLNNERVYTRDPNQPQAPIWEEIWDMPGQEELNKDVYLIYGTAHPSQTQGNIVYKPLKYNGTLPPVVDPTDPAIFSQLSSPPHAGFLSEPKDITVKVTYVDGSVLHALNPFHSYFRPPYTDNFGIWRYDLSNFSLVVPGDKAIQKVEVFKRPFCVKDVTDNTEGNINFPANNITAANFMNAAELLSVYDGTKVLGPNSIGNRVWHDYNRNGINEPNEPGIADVSVVLWTDEDNDGTPDDFSGVVKTDANGHYRFEGLSPGNYITFVWSVDNWDVGEPLHGFMPSSVFVADPNTDIDLDNSGTGFPFTDILSGIITLTASGEPLNDGDPLDEWFDYDPAGNMTVDFGLFHEDLLYWIGVSNTDWANPNNWAGNIVPDVDSDVIIPEGAPFYPIVDENVQIHTLCVEQGATLEVLQTNTFEVLVP